MSQSEDAAATQRTRIKFCGMTCVADVELAQALGVDMVGLVFAPRSPRRLDVVRGRSLRDACAASTRVVALLMDQARADVQAILTAVKPDLLQFHGDEADGFCASFGLPFLKAMPMRGVDVAALPERLARYPSARGFVFDGHAPGAMGGSGERFDWRLLSASRIDRPWLLAGGLDAGNVEHAVRTAHPWGVDVSSGIESAPGAKDPQQMRAFVAAVHAADASAVTLD